jgi:exodeoxyribonuclease VII large subunit
MTGFLWSDDADAFFGDDPAKKPIDLNAQPNRAAGRGNKRQSASSPSPGASSDSPISVSQLNQWIKRSIEQNISGFWLAGEVGNLNQSASGHVYMTIKDSTSQIAAVMWRSTFERVGIDLREGMAILVQGRVEVYPPRGSYQIIINRIEQQGLGALQAAFRKLHAKLQKEGLFDSERKKTLPQFPSRIGFVTSPSGAAIHDFTQVLKRRWPGASVLIIPAKVQGDGASLEIANGIQLAERIRPSLDVLVIGRGGGSLEDLWCFNEEIVVRAVAACSLPTVSAVGHEIDVTLCDLAADVRALTPSEAAERIVPSREEIADSLNAIQQRVDSLIAYRMGQHQLKLNSMASRPVFLHPERLLETPVLQLDALHQSLDASVDAALQQRMEQLTRLSSVLEAISPLKTLARGYSVTLTEDESVITSVKQVTSGQEIVTKLVDGAIRSRVT